MRDAIRKIFSGWTAKIRARRERATTAFLDSKKYDIATIDATYSDVDKNCMNCKAPLKGPFCRACGQKDDDLRRPIWSFLRELLDSLIDADNKIFKTLILLVLVPGGLTRAFVNGRRATFSPPLRLYLVVSVLFFMVLSASDLVLMDIKVTAKATVATEETAVQKPPNPVEDSNQTGSEDLTNDDDSASEKAIKRGAERVAVLKEAIKGIDDEDLAALESVLENVGDGDEELRGIVISDGNVEIDDDWPFDVNLSMFVEPDLENRIGMDQAVIDEVLSDNDNPEFVKNIVQGAERLLLEPTLSNEIFNKWLPRILIILIPVFAFFLRLSHWGKQRYYFNQIIFSLHFHTFLFLLMGALMVIIPRFGGEVGAAVFWWSSLIYLFVALKVAQDQGWFRTIFKFIMLGSIYFFLLLMGLFAALSLGLAEV